MSGDDGEPPWSPLELELPESEDSEGSFPDELPLSPPLGQRQPRVARSAPRAPRCGWSRSRKPSAAVGEADAHEKPLPWSQGPTPLLPQAEPALRSAQGQAEAATSPRGCCASQVRTGILAS